MPECDLSPTGIGYETTIGEWYTSIRRRADGQRRNWLSGTFDF